MKPYIKAQTIPLGEKFDRRRKLTDEEKKEIKEIYDAGGIGCRKLAAMYGVSRSLIQTIVIPGRAEANRERIKRMWKTYHDKYGQAYYTDRVRSWRQYKYRLYKEGKLKEAKPCAETI